MPGKDRIAPPACRDRFQRQHQPPQVVGARIRHCRAKTGRGDRRWRFRATPRYPMMPRSRPWRLVIQGGANSADMAMRAIAFVRSVRGEKHCGSC